MIPAIHANGATIPSIGLGTWNLRGRECAKAVADALGVGYRHLDTAAMYGNEEAVGDGVRASGLKRDDVFITTKVWHDALRDGALQRSAEASLKRLELEAVDLLLIHWPNRSVPLKESIAALCDTKRRGLARHIGVANFNIALLDESNRLATEPLVANQCEYHPRLDQSRLIAACRAYGMAFVSYSPLGRGEAVREPAVAAVAKQHRKTPAQIVLRWHTQQAGVAAIPKSANAARIAENIALFDFELTPTEMDRISAESRPHGRMLDPGWAKWD
jgi:diketogulonate reductase-like aldo/keto reductase